MSVGGSEAAGTGSEKGGREDGDIRMGCRKEEWGWREMKMEVGGRERKAVGLSLDQTMAMLM